jgi:trans-2,3-dihydro-3-hydroxyanthranilate isomerase
MDRRAYVVADVFTDTPLEGNQLAVFGDGAGIDDVRMQRIARELNLSETVFVLPPEHDGNARIRIFTPTTELPFAGHPVLGTAFALGTQRGLDVVRLETRATAVAVELERRDGAIAFGWFEHPVPPWEPFADADAVLAALGLERSVLPVEAYRNGPTHVFVALEDEAAVAALTPDHGALAAFVGVGVNCFAGDGVRWKTRMFGTGLGMTEDPATGSAAGPLAIHLARHGRTAFGDEIIITQGVEIGRPSRLHARADGSAGHVERVRVGGASVVVAEGTYRIA